MNIRNVMKYCQSARLGILFKSIIQLYNHDKYWKRRSIVVNPHNSTPILIKLYYLWYIKRCDAFNNCSFGTNLNSGAYFTSPPILPHGPNGIIVGHDLIFNGNVTIFQQVTIMHGGEVKSAIM